MESHELEAFKDDGHFQPIGSVPKLRAAMEQQQRTIGTHVEVPTISYSPTIGGNNRFRAASKFDPRKDRRHINVNAEVLEALVATSDALNMAQAQYEYHQQLTRQHMELHGQKPSQALLEENVLNDIMSGLIPEDLPRFMLRDQEGAEAQDLRSGANPKHSGGAMMNKSAADFITAGVPTVLRGRPARSLWGYFGALQRLAPPSGTELQALASPLTVLSTASQSSASSPVTSAKRAPPPWEQMQISLQTPAQIWRPQPPVDSSWADIMQRRKRQAYLRRLVRMTTTKNKHFERNHAARIIQNAWRQYKQGRKDKAERGISDLKREVSRHRAMETSLRAAATHAWAQMVRPEEFGMSTRAVSIKERAGSRAASRSVSRSISRAYSRAISSKEPGFMRATSRSVSRRFPDTTPHGPEWQSGLRFGDSVSFAERSRSRADALVGVDSLLNSLEGLRGAASRGNGLGGNGGKAGGEAQLQKAKSKLVRGHIQFADDLGSSVHKNTGEAGGSSELSSSIQEQSADGIKDEIIRLASIAKGLGISKKYGSKKAGLNLSATLGSGFLIDIRTDGNHVEGSTHVDSGARQESEDGLLKGSGDGLLLASQQKTVHELVEHYDSLVNSQHRSIDESLNVTCGQVSVGGAGSLPGSLSHVKDSSPSGEGLDGFSGDDKSEYESMSESEIPELGEGLLQSLAAAAAAEWAQPKHMTRQRQQHLLWGQIKLLDEGLGLEESKRHLETSAEIRPEEDLSQSPVSGAIQGLQQPNGLGQEPTSTPESGGQDQDDDYMTVPDSELAGMTDYELQQALEAAKGDKPCQAREWQYQSSGPGRQCSRRKGLVNDDSGPAREWNWQEPPQELRSGRRLPHASQVLPEVEGDSRSPATTTNTAASDDDDDDDDDVMWTGFSVQGQNKTLGKVSAEASFRCLAMAQSEAEEEGLNEEEKAHLIEAVAEQLAPITPLRHCQEVDEGETSPKYWAAQLMLSFRAWQDSGPHNLVGSLAKSGLFASAALSAVVAAIGVTDDSTHEEEEGNEPMTPKRVVIGEATEYQAKPCTDAERATQMSLVRNLNRVKLRLQQRVCLTVDVALQRLRMLRQVEDMILRGYGARQGKALTSSQNHATGLMPRGVLAGKDPSLRYSHLLRSTLQQQLCLKGGRWPASIDYRSYSSPPPGVIVEGKALLSTNWDPSQRLLLDQCFKGSVFGTGARPVSRIGQLRMALRRSHLPRKATEGKARRFRQPVSNFGVGCSGLEVTASKLYPRGSAAPISPLKSQLSLSAPAPDTTIPSISSNNKHCPIHRFRIKDRCILRNAPVAVQQWHGRWWKTQWIDQWHQQRKELAKLVAAASAAGYSIPGELNLGFVQPLLPHHLPVGPGVRAVKQLRQRQQHQQPNTQCSVPPLSPRCAYDLPRHNISCVPLVMTQRQRYLGDGDSLPAGTNVPVDPNIETAYPEPGSPHTSGSGSPLQISRASFMSMSSPLKGTDNAQTPTIQPHPPLSIPSCSSPCLQSPRIHSTSTVRSHSQAQHVGIDVTASCSASFQPLNISSNQRLSTSESRPLIGTSLKQQFGGIVDPGSLGVVTGRVLVPRRREARHSAAEYHEHKQHQGMANINEQRVTRLSSPGRTRTPLYSQPCAQQSLTLEDCLLVRGTVTSAKDQSCHEQISKLPGSLEIMEKGRHRPATSQARFRPWQPVQLDPHGATLLQVYNIHGSDHVNGSASPRGRRNSSADPRT